MSETQTAAVAQPLTSEKLQTLKLQAIEAWKAQSQFADPFTKEAKDAKLAFLKIEAEMKGEESSLVKAANEAKIAEARNQRIALVKTLLDAHNAILTAPKSVTAEAKAILQSTFDTAREVVENELLAKFASSKPAKIADNGETATTGRNTESKAAILELYHAGKTHAEIEAAGFARSTVWHTINNYKKANGQ